MNKGDRFVLHHTNGKDYEGIVVSYNLFREPGMEYAIDLEGMADVLFVGENFFKDNNVEVLNG